MKPVIWLHGTSHIKWINHIVWLTKCYIVGLTKWNNKWETLISIVCLSQIKCYENLAAFLQQTHYFSFSWSTSSYFLYALKLATIICKKARLGRHVLFLFAASNITHHRTLPISGLSKFVIMATKSSAHRMWHFYYCLSVLVIFVSKQNTYFFNVIIISKPFFSSFSMVVFDMKMSCLQRFGVNLLLELNVAEIEPFFEEMYHA